MRIKKGSFFLYIFCILIINTVQTHGVADRKVPHLFNCLPAYLNASKPGSLLPCASSHFIAASSSEEARAQPSPALLALRYAACIM